MPKLKQKFNLTPLAKCAIATTFGVAALGYGVHSLFFGPKAPNDNPQQTASVYSEENGRTYRIWEGVVHEELDNRTGFSEFQTTFDHHVYDFDLGVIIHVPNENNGGLTRTLFRDANPDHIERVRRQGQEIAEHYIKLSKKPEYGPPPEDVMHFYETHVKNAQEKEKIQEPVSNLQSLDDIPSSVLNAGKEQKTAGWYHEQDGRSYVIWDGVILEELDNRTGYSDFDTGFDMNVYDFDLGVVIHTPNSHNGGMASTPFSQVNSEHIERIRNVGKALCDGYIRRAKTSEYGPPPEDVMTFYNRHVVAYGLENHANNNALELSDTQKEHADEALDGDASPVDEDRKQAAENLFEGVDKETYNAGEIQKTAGWYTETDGRSYRIWEGLVHEELDNNTGFSDFETTFDHHVYDFDLGVVIHVPNGIHGGLTRTSFSELNADHLERVRKIAIKLAEAYIKRSKTVDYGPVPEDVLQFYKRHNQPISLDQPKAKIKALKLGL